MMGGYWFKDLFGDPDDVKKEILVQTALQSLCDEVGITHQDPLYCVVNILKVIHYYTNHHHFNAISLRLELYTSVHSWSWSKDW